jgi:hypothetical protein
MLIHILDGARIYYLVLNLRITLEPQSDNAVPTGPNVIKHFSSVNYDFL